jgi:hypothetical protein
MSQVTIQGNASGTGTITLTAPNTSTDRTVTLPNATGTLLTSPITSSDTDGSIGPTHTASGTAPSSPSLLDVWNDTTNEKLYMRTNDGTSNLWLEIS